jgi:hypothetical protein
MRYLKLTMFPVKLLVDWENLQVNGAWRICSRVNQTGIFMSGCDICSWIVHIEMCNESPRNITTKLLLKTIPVRYRPSKLMHWWTLFIAHSIMQSWEVVWHFFAQKFLVWDFVSLPNVSETLFFSNSPMKEITSQQSGQVGWPRNVAMNVVIFGKVSKAGLRSMFLLHGVPSWSYGELSFHALSTAARWRT